MNIVPSHYEKNMTNVWIYITVDDYILFYIRKPCENKINQMNAVNYFNFFIRYKMFIKLFSL